MDINRRGLFLRAQRMKDSFNEDNDETAETQLLQRFNTKFGFPFTPSTNEKSKSTNGVIESSFDTQPKTEQDNGFSTTTSTTTVSPISSSDLTSPAGRPGAALAKFRQAGMKARLATRMEKIVEDRMTAGQIFSRFVKDSTLHGFRFIFTKTFYIRRFVWLMITLTMAGLFLKELKNSISLYYLYPFTTTSTLDYVPEIKFPAISICNLNDFRLSRLNNAQLKLYFANKEGNWTDSAFDMNGNDFAHSMKAASHDIKDMFKRCEWIQRDTAAGNRNRCNHTNFTSYYDTNGQTCYTFNSGKKAHPILKQNQTGPFHAFDLILDLESHEHLRDIQEAGVRIVIHHQTETPLGSSGFVAAPGFQTFVEIKLQEVQNLRPPYATKCGSKSLSYFHGTGYRKSKCFLDELTKSIASKCGCRGLFIPESTRLPLCSFKKTVNCLIPVISNFDRKGGRVCPEDCHNINFLHQLSYARFISRPPPHGIVKFPFLDKMNFTTRTERDDYIRDNIVALKFYYQDLKIENVTQTPSYNFYKLVGDVGGQLGLMLGASVLTLVEFIDLMAFIFYHQMLRLSRRKKKDRKMKHDEEELNHNWKIFK